MEIEVKYAALAPIEPEDVEALEYAPYSLGARETHELRDTLLDTAGGAIRSRDFSFRLRRDGPLTFLTLKGPKQEAGIAFRREEVEAVLEGDPGDMDHWPPPIRERVMALSGGEPLQPLVRVENRRYTWQVGRDGATVAEIALDRGTIRAGALSEPMHELEVELKEGEDADVRALVAILTAALPLAPETRGKANRGYRLLAQSSGASRSTGGEK